MALQPERKLGSYRFERTPRGKTPDAPKLLSSADLFRRPREVHIQKPRLAAVGSDVRVDTAGAKAHTYRPLGVPGLAWQIVGGLLALGAILKSKLVGVLGAKAIVGGLAFKLVGLVAMPPLWVMLPIFVIVAIALAVALSRFQSGK